MTCLITTPPSSGKEPALLTLTLPQALIAQALRTAEQAAGRPDAAEIEYASWMPDPGAIELASWSTHLRASVR